MIDALKPYPAYKDANLPWLGRVPQHWAEQRAKYFFREVDERSTTGEEELLSVSHVTGVTPRKQNVTMFMAESNVGHKVCRPGDLVINTMWAFMAALGVAKQTGVVSPSYGVYRPRQPGCLLPDFVDHLLRVDAYKSEYLCRSTGIRASRLRLYPEQFLRIPILCPPPDEQAAIVRFLRHLERRVRRYIRAKRRIIDLLNEQKQAIIHRAVSRGLNPNVHLKSSGVEWLGDVPDHWILKRFKFVTSITSGQVDPREPEYRNQVLIAPNHIESGSGRIIRQETADHQGADSGKYLVQAGQIIYSKIRPNLRKAAIATTDCLCSADMYPIWPRTSELHPEYLLMLLLSEPFTKYAVDCSMRVAMPKINRQALGECRLWYPPLVEQDKILRHLKERLSLPDEAAAAIRREVEYVRNFRARLAADVVSGNLDVRKAVAFLPDEPDEMEPVDETDIFADGDDDIDANAVPEEADA